MPTGTRTCSSLWSTPSLAMIPMVARRRTRCLGSWSGGDDPGAVAAFTLCPLEKPTKSWGWHMSLAVVQASAPNGP